MAQGRARCRRPPRASVRGVPSRRRARTGRPHCALAVAGVRTRVRERRGGRRLARPRGALAPGRRPRRRARLARPRAVGARARQPVVGSAGGLRPRGCAGSRRHRPRASCARAARVRRGVARKRGRGPRSPRRGHGGRDERRAGQPRDVRRRLLHADARLRAGRRHRPPAAVEPGPRRLRAEVRPRDAARLLPHVLRRRLRREWPHRCRRGGAGRRGQGADRSGPAVALRPSCRATRRDSRPPGSPRRGGAAPRGLRVRSRRSPRGGRGAPRARRDAQRGSAPRSAP